MECDTWLLHFSGLDSIPCVSKQRERDRGLGGWLPLTPLPTVRGIYYFMLVNGYLVGSKGKIRPPTGLKDRKKIT